MKQVICPSCGRPYNLGYNGVVEGCDRCIGIERDKADHAWYPGETEHVYLFLDDGTEYLVTREQAFTDASA